jgi:hypothetical protein
MVNVRGGAFTQGRNKRRWGQKCFVPYHCALPKKQVSVFALAKIGGFRKGVAAAAVESAEFFVHPIPRRHLPFSLTLRLGVVWRAWELNSLASSGKTFGGWLRVFVMYNCFKNVGDVVFDFQK